MLGEIVGDEGVRPVLQIASAIVTVLSVKESALVPEGRWASFLRMNGAYSGENVKGRSGPSQ